MFRRPLIDREAMVKKKNRQLSHVSQTSNNNKQFSKFRRRYIN